MPHTASQPLYPKLTTEGKEKIYLGIDLLDVDSNSEKRKLVSVIFHEGKLTVRKFDHKKFEQYLNFQNGKVFINNDLVHLVFYVENNNSLKKCSEELNRILETSGDIGDKEKIIRIKAHFNSVWKNVREFDTYSAMVNVYDRNTGNFIHNSVNKLGVIYLDIENKYMQLKADNSVPEGGEEIIANMKDILDKMKDIYEKNRNDFHHLSTNTVSPVADAFNKLVSKFEEKVLQLDLLKSNAERSKQFKLLENSLVRLQTNCEKLIPENAMCTEELFDERKGIRNEIKHLLLYINDLSKHTVADTVITGLQEKFSTIEKKLRMFRHKVNIQSNEGANNDVAEKIQLEQMNKYFQYNIQPILDNIQNYSEKTSPEKANILKRIVEDFNDLKQKIIAKVTISEIKEIIIQIKVFIQTKFEMLATSRGFFSSQGKSVDFIKDLKLKLEDLIQTDNVQDQSIPRP